jgi:formylglycine-generating enzyme required for sulfatase activity
VPKFSYRDHKASDGRNDPDADSYMPGLYRIVRGGSYREGADTLRAARRSASPPDSKLRWRGFRLALILGKEE